MIVDDEVTTALLVKNVLEDEGIDVIVASSGEECLEILKKERPDLILLDIMMYGMDGWETLERIRKMKGGKSIPVSMFTIRADVSDAMFAMKVEGVVDYITKPFDHRELIQRVEKILQKESK